MSTQPTEHPPLWGWDTVLTFDADPRNPHPADVARVAATPTPNRGRNTTPAWFEFHDDRNGWLCRYPHPDPTVLKGAHYIPNATSHGLAHLNTHHPGWKLPCTRCGKPQWNAENRPTCFDCRTPAPARQRGARP